MRVCLAQVAELSRSEGPTSLLTDPGLHLTDLHHRHCPSMLLYMLDAPHLGTSVAFQLSHVHLDLHLGGYQFPFSALAHCRHDL